MSAFPKWAYIEFTGSYPLNADALVANQTLQDWGVYTYRKTREELLVEKGPSLMWDSTEQKYTQSLFVGSAPYMQLIFSHLDKEPPPMSYPAALQQPAFMGRRVRQLQTGEAIDEFRQTGTPFFIKSVAHKGFSGILIRESRQLAYLEAYEAMPAWVSEPVRFLSEWRCFVHKGKLVDCRPEQGDFRRAPDYRTVEAMISAFTDAPVAYALDVGLTQTNRTLLVEVNDFWAIDSLGLNAEVYVQMLSDRYRQIIEV